MKEKVNIAIERWAMLEGCKGVVVGLSGGADSVSLLHVLHGICLKRGIALCAVHVNHGIRGESASRDEQFCREFCASLGVPIDVYSYDIPSLAQKQGIGIEECGRNFRYLSFEQSAEKRDCGCIATAHTLSDSAETLLLNLTRGCGIAGLRGIPPVRGNIIRPLILADRDDIEKYCADNNLEYVTDETNSDDTFSRNRIRRNVVTQLRLINPSFLSAAGRLIQSAAIDEEYLSSQAREALETIRISDDAWQADKLYDLPLAVRRRAIISIADKISGKEIDFTHIELIERMLKNGSGAVTLSGGQVICCENGRLQRQKQKVVSEQWCRPASQEVVLPDGRVLWLRVFRGCQWNDFCAEFVNPGKNNKYLFNWAINCDIINLNGLIRGRREGDTFSPAGRGVTKTVKKLFNEARIPPERRGDTVLIELNGKLIWAEGFGPAEGFRASDDSQCVTFISLHDQSESCTAVD